MGTYGMPITGLLRSNPSTTKRKGRGAMLASRQVSNGLVRCVHSNKIEGPEMTEKCSIHSSILCAVKGNEWCGRGTLMLTPLPVIVNHLLRRWQVSRSTWLAGCALWVNDTPCSVCSLWLQTRLSVLGVRRRRCSGSKANVLAPSQGLVNEVCPL